MSDQVALARAMAAAPASTVPDFAARFAPRVEADGRLFLVGELSGANVYVQPKDWKTMRFSPDSAEEYRPDAGAAINYGVNLAKVQEHAGRLETNDPSFGRSLISPAECRPEPKADPAAAYQTPALILAVGLVAAALAMRFRRFPPLP